ncbi:uncharacterized protein JCM6883_004187 [Sporobolomyces salmoneus]|uniref:uncharacterized protein n=1 Tax=Sporobolomyces salmoneus TaxID=183962 RepID=UPI00316D650E
MCTFCLAAFTVQNSLIRHVRKLHTTRTGRTKCDRCHSTWIMSGDKNTIKRHRTLECPVDEDGDIDSDFEWDEIFGSCVRKHLAESASTLDANEQQGLPSSLNSVTPPSTPRAHSTSQPLDGSPNPPQTQSPAPLQLDDLNSLPPLPPLDPPPPEHESVFSAVELPTDLETYWIEQDYSGAYFDPFPSSLS